MLNVKYFAYGSNINHERIQDRVCNFKEILPRGISYTLQNYELVFNAGCGYANIVEKVGESVEGLLYDLTPEQFNILDRYELLYNKFYFKIDINTIGCVYIAKNTDNRFNFLTRKPSLEYLNIIIDGCKEAQLTKTYEKLVEFKLANYKLKKSKHKKN